MNLEEEAYIIQDEKKKEKVGDGPHLQGVSFDADACSNPGIRKITKSKTGIVIDPNPLNAAPIIWNQDIHQVH